MARDPESSRSPRPVRSGTLLGVGREGDVPRQRPSSGQAAELAAALAGERDREAPAAPSPPTTHDSAPPQAEAAAATTALSPGQIVAGKFALLRLIAEGGLAQVYEAEDTLVGRRVALKVLLPEHAASSDVVRRFRREAHATALVAHPNVVTVFEMGRRADGSLYIVQELLAGPTLHEHRVARGRLEEVEVLRLLTPIAGALATAHGQGVVHRDVKPGNIVLSTTPFSELVPKLIDFGVARVETPRGRGKTLAGTLLGTAQYMSPEQALGEVSIDGRTDVWALGVVLYEMLSGAYPFDGPNDHAILAKVLGEAVPDLRTRAPWVRSELANLVRAALERDVAKRPSMRAMYLELLGLSAASQGVVASDVDEAALPGSEIGEVEVLDIDPDPEPSEAPAEARANVLALEPDEDDAQTEILQPLDDADIEVVEGPRVAPEALAAREWMRATGQVATDLEGAGFAVGGEAAARFAESAQRALQVNALEEAVLHAEMGVAQGAEGELLGRLRLVEAIALYWLGRYAAADARAEDAMMRLPAGTTGWYAALGHLVMARGRLGEVASLGELRERLGAFATDRLAPPHVIAVARLAVALTSAGSLVAARQLVRGMRDAMDRHAAGEAVVLAWLDLAFAERAMFVGDPTRELTRHASAYERFTSAGDVRNACQERAAYGAALLRVGAFDESERVLHEALGIAEPMKLLVTGSAKSSLALAALRQGELERASSLATDAVRWAREHGDVAVEATTRVYLARIHVARGEPALGLVEAEAAVPSAAPFPAVQAHALGVLADTLLELDRPTQAREAALRAVALLDEHGGAGEAESLIRLTHALSLAATGDADEARRRLQDARARLHALSTRIADPRHKRWFLERIAENARIVELSRAGLEGA